MCMGESRRRLRRAMAARSYERVGVGDAQLQQTARVARLLPSSRLVGHLDRLAEVRDRLLERRAAQRLIPGDAPIFDRGFCQAGAGEMMRERFGLGGGAIRKLVAQSLRDAPVQGEAAALEQVF